MGSVPKLLLIFVINSESETGSKAAPAKRPDLDQGFDAYSLDDILAEFRDS